MDITSFLNQDGSLPLSIVGTKKVADNEEIGIGGFTMFATIENTKTLSSTAPTVTLEDGSKTSDTIFLNPIQVSIIGVVSDVFVKRDATAGIFSPVERVIGIVSQYLPNKTQSQITQARAIVDDAKNVIRRINAAIEDGKRLYGEFGDQSSSKPLQEQFLDRIEQIHFSKALISIETPFRVYENMRIIKFPLTVNNESDEIRFKIDAVQIGFRTLQTVTVASIEPAPKPSSGLKGATGQAADKGTTAGKPVPETKSTSLLSTIFG